MQSIESVQLVFPSLFHHTTCLNSTLITSSLSLISSCSLLLSHFLDFLRFYFALLTRYFFHIFYKTFLQSAVCFYFPLHVFCYMTLTHPRAGKRKCPRIRHNFGWLVYSNNVSSCNWKQACVAAFVNPKRSLDRFDFAGIHNKSESATIRKLGIIIVKRK